MFAIKIYGSQAFAFNNALNMRYLTFLFLLFTAAIGFAAEDASDEQSSKQILESQFNPTLELQNAGLYDKALEGWNNLLKKHPKSDLALEAKYNRGLCNYKLEKFKEAKEDFDEVLKFGDKLSKKAEALLFCGLSAQRLSEKNPAMTQDAQNRLEELLKDYPNSNNILFAKFNLALVYEQQKKLKQAKELYEGIWKESLKNKGTGKNKETEEYDYAPEAYLKTCSINFAQGLYDECAQLALGFSKHWNKKPEIYVAAVLAGDALYSSGKYDKAEEQYAFASNPNAAEIDKFDRQEYAAYNRGVCNILLQNYKKAAELFSDFITKYPKSEYIFSANLVCGDAYWKLADVQKAKEFLFKAAKSEQCSPKANLILAEIFFSEKDIVQALKYIDLVPESQFKCLPTEPEAQQADVRQACVLRVNILSKSNDQKRNQTCVGFCDNIALQWSDTPFAPWATFKAALIQASMHNYDDAIERCRKIQTKWKESPQYLDSQILEADCLRIIKKYKEAGALFKTLYYNNPDDSRRIEWLISCCKMLDLQQQYSEIYSILSKEMSNIKTSDLYPDALYMLGKSAEQLNNLDLALKALKACQQEKYQYYSGIDKVLFVQGTVYLKKNDNKNALESFQKILDKYPDSSVNQAASFYATQLYRSMGNFDSALAQADKIIAQDVSNVYRPGALLDSMFILIQKGVFDQAIERGDLFIKDYPDHENAAQVYQFRSLSKYNLKKFSEATLDSRKGLEIAKQKEQLDKWELPLRRLEVSSLAQQDNKIDELQKAFNDFMDAKQRHDKSDVKEDTIVFLYANALYKANKKDEAYKQYQYLYDNFKTSEYLFESAYSLGEQAANSKQFDKAKELLLFAAKGTDVIALIKSAHKLGWIYYDEKDYGKGFNCFTRSFKTFDAVKDFDLSSVDDIVLDSRIMAADCLYWQKRFAEALVIYKELPDLPVQYRVMATLRSAQCALETKDPELAASLINKVLDDNNAIISELEPTSKIWEPALQHMRAKIWFKTNKRDQAEKLFEQIVKQNENVNRANMPETCYLAIAESWYYLGELTFLKGNFRDAIPKFYNVIYGYNIPDLQADSCYEAARCFESIKQVNQAKKMYKKIIDEFPNSSKAATARSKYSYLK